MENNQQIEAILNSLHSIQKAAAPPFFSAELLDYFFRPLIRSANIHSN